LRQGREVDHLNLEEELRRDHLDRLPRGDLERGAQRLVAADDPVYGRSEHSYTERSFDPGGAGDVVGGGAGLELVEDPLAELREGDRKRLAGPRLPRDAGGRRSRGRLALVELAQEKLALFRGKLGQAGGQIVHDGSFKAVKCTLSCEEPAVMEFPLREGCLRA